MDFGILDTVVPFGMMTHKFDGFYRIFQSGIGVPGFL
jgi:hypothetical protein